MQGPTIIDYIYHGDEFPLPDDMQAAADGLRDDKKNPDLWLSLAIGFEARMNRIRTSRWAIPYECAESVYIQALKELPGHPALQEAYIQLQTFKSKRSQC